MPSIAELNASLVKPENVTRIAENVTNVTKSVAEKMVPLSKYNALLRTLATTKTFMWVYFALAIVASIFAFLIYWKYAGRIKRLAKKNYGWVHIISAGKIKSYFMKMSSHYRIDGALYIGDESCDLIEYGTNLRHKFFFEDSPYQILFVPTGVKITPPKGVPESVKAKFESIAPKIIHIKSPVSSRVLDALLHRSAIFGREITNLGKGFFANLTKENAIGILIIGLALIMLIKGFFGR